MKLPFLNLVLDPAKIAQVRFRNGPDGPILFEGRSKYQFFRVTQSLKENMRWMFSGRGLMGGANMKTGLPSVPYYFLSDITNPEAKSALFLGGGPCVVPTYVWRQNPQAKIVVIEVDPLTIDLAKRYFQLPEDKRYRVYLNDARSFLQKDKRRYDIIFLDVGLSRETITQHSQPLCTIEGLTLLKNHLKREGVLIANVIAARKGKKATLFQDCWAAFKHSFRTVYVFPDFLNRPERIQDIYFLAARRKMDFKKMFRMAVKKKKLKHDKNYYQKMVDKMLPAAEVKKGGKILYDKNFPPAAV